MLENNCQFSVTLTKISRPETIFDMASFDVTAFVSWSSVTAIFFVMTVLVYRKFTKRNNNESHKA
jgi:hypothetical protein